MPSAIGHLKHEVTNLKRLGCLKVLWSKILRLTGWDEAVIENHLRDYRAHDSKLWGLRVILNPAIEAG